MTPIYSIQCAVDSFYDQFFTNKGAKTTREKTFMKIIEEVGELAETTNKNWSVEDQEKEFGDVIVTVLMHGIVSGYNLQRVADYIVPKLEHRKSVCSVVNNMIVKNKDIK
jgi:NTP pyrophosphatase (non-canonical NTP hydrolase)